MLLATTVASGQFAGESGDVPAEILVADAFYESSISQLRVKWTSKRGTLLVKYQSGLKNLRDEYLDRESLYEASIASAELERLTSKWSIEKDDVLSFPTSLGTAQERLLSSLSSLLVSEARERFEFQCGFLHKLEIMLVRAKLSGDERLAGLVKSKLRAYRSEIQQIPEELPSSLLLSQSLVR